VSETRGGEGEGQGEGERRPRGRGGEKNGMKRAKRQDARG
jgi:hypothetical protein